MWVDGIIAVIIIVSLILGYRNGFAYTFVRTVGWILAVVLGFVWYPHVIQFLKEKTGFYDSVHAAIANRIAENINSTADTALTGIPDVISDLFSKAINAAADALSVSMADNFSNIIFNIIGFLVVAIAIKLVLMFITRIFSKKSNDGIIGGIDGFFGILAGAARGIIIVYLLLALLVPVTSLTGSPVLSDAVGSSVIGDYLYNNNLIFSAVKDFL